MPKITQAAQGTRCPAPEEVQVLMGAQIPGWPAEGSQWAPELRREARGGNPMGFSDTLGQGCAWP